VAFTTFGTFAFFRRSWAAGGGVGDAKDGKGGEVVRGRNQGGRELAEWANPARPADVEGRSGDAGRSSRHVGSRPLHAYILAADPGWLIESVMSYYRFLERLVVAFDERGVGWTGRPTQALACVERLKSAESEGKMVFLPGHFHRPGIPPLELETAERNAALEAAAPGAAWVLQFDTDEILTDPETFFSCLEEADRSGALALEYPARTFLGAVGPSWLIERRRRLRRVSAGYPGPVAVRPDLSLVHCRQVATTPFRVDIRRRNTDPAHAPDAPVHRVISSRSAIAHLSWVRSTDELAQKFGTWGHADGRGWNAVQHYMGRIENHPYRALVAAFDRRRPPSVPRWLLPVPRRVLLK